jgi:hypothetical protein
VIVDRIIVGKEIRMEQVRIGQRRDGALLLFLAAISHEPSTQVDHVSKNPCILEGIEQTIFKMFQTVADAQWQTRIQQDQLVVDNVDDVL